VDHITIEDALRMKAQNRDRLIEDDLRQYLALCDRLQVENARIPYSFIRRLLQELAQLRHRRKINTFQALLDNVTITIEKIEEEKGSSVVTIIIPVFILLCSLLALFPPTTPDGGLLSPTRVGAIFLGPDGQVLQMPSDETARKRFVRQEVHKFSSAT
jgi:hypothetical protein